MTISWSNELPVEGREEVGAQPGSQGSCAPGFAGGADAIKASVESAGSGTVRVFSSEAVPAKDSWDEFFDFLLSLTPLHEEYIPDFRDIDGLTDAPAILERHR